jgi:hypothetical protein
MTEEDTFNTLKKLPFKELYFLREKHIHRKIGEPFPYAKYGWEVDEFYRALAKYDPG